MKMPFKKSSYSNTVPSEVQNYYQSERRDRAGIAWVLALGTLMLTLILAFGLFFGGRWAYRKVANKDNKPTQTASQTKTAEEKKAADSKKSDNPGSTTNNSGSTGTSSTNTTTPSNAVAPATTTSSGQLPNTGPASE